MKYRIEVKKQGDKEIDYQAQVCVETNRNDWPFTGKELFTNLCKESDGTFIMGMFSQRVENIEIAKSIINEHKLLFNPPPIIEYQYINMD